MIYNDINGDKHYKILKPGVCNRVRNYDLTEGVKEEVNILNFPSNKWEQIMTTLL